MKKGFSIILLLFYSVVLYGNTANQIALNNQVIDRQTERVKEDNSLQERDIKIRYLITVFQLNLIFLKNILIVIEINEFEE